MFAAQLVQPGQDRGGGHRLAVDADGIALFETDLDVFGRIRGLFGGHGALIDIIGCVLRGIFKHLALGRGMQKVRIDGEGRFAALVLGDGDLVGFGKFQQFRPAGQVPFTPGRDDLDFGVQRIGRQFEPYLIVALACRAMGYGIGAGFLSDLDQTLGNERARNGGAQQVQPFVDGVGPEHRKDEIAHEFLAQVFDVDVLDAHHLGFLARGLQLLPLTEVGGEGDDFAAVFRLQPFQDDGGIETAGVGENHFLGRGHADFLSVSLREVTGFAQTGKIEACVDPAGHRAYRKRRLQEHRS